MSVKCWLDLAHYYLPLGYYSINWLFDLINSDYLRTVAILNGSNIIKNNNKFLLKIFFFTFAKIIIRSIYNIILMNLDNIFFYLVSNWKENWIEVWLNSKFFIIEDDNIWDPYLFYIILFLLDNQNIDWKEPQ